MPTPIFPDRETIVTISDYLDVMTEQAIRIDRDHSDMARDSQVKQTNVHHLPNVGWQLRGIGFDPGNVHERTIGNAEVMTVANGKLQVAPNHSLLNIWQKVTATGLTASGADVSGDPMYGKTLQAATTWDQKLNHSIPSPTTSQDTYPIDLVAIGTEVHRPTEQIHFSFIVPGGFADKHGTILEFYFCAPAGSDKFLVGNGQYCIKFFADGKANLYERGYLPSDATKAIIWKVRWKRFAWSQTPTINGRHWVTITSNAYESGVVNGESKYRGDKILINCNEIAPGDQNNIVDALISVAVLAINAGKGYKIPTYNIPLLTQEEVSLIVPRAGVRRDLRALFQIAKSTYPTTGELVDDIFSLEFAPTDDLNFEFEWYAHTPKDTTIDAKLYKVVRTLVGENHVDTETELTNVGGGFTDKYGGKKFYTPAPGVRYYRVRYFYTSNGERTPTVLSWRLLRESVIRSITGYDEEIELYDSLGGAVQAATAMVTGIDISGEGAEMNDEAAAIAVTDLTNRYPALAYPGRPIKIETTYNPGGDRSVLFEGEIEHAPYLAQPIKGYPDARQYDIGCTGYFRRMSEQFSADRFTAWDRVANKHMKVTDLIFLALRGCGIPTAEIDVPDIALRAFGANADELKWEPGTRLYEYATMLARDYFGAYIIRDHNAGARGMVRMLRPPANLNVPLARFTPNMPTGGTKLQSVSNSYGSDTISGQTVLRTFIKRKTASESWQRPEGNMVIVIGAAAAGAASKAGTAVPAQLTQTAWNVKSYNFLGLADGHARCPHPTDVTRADGQNPHFLGRVVPIWYMDATLSTQKSVDWVCRRIYQMTTFPFLVKRFVAPLLLVTDVSDTLQTRPRKLRFYDRVEVYNNDTAAWEKFLVRKVQPSYMKDGIQMANYELVGGPLLDQYAMLPDRNDAEKFRQDTWRRGLGLTYRSGQTKQSQRTMWNKQAWMNLPTLQAESIQHLDPDLASFGELKWTLDYSPLI